MILETIWELDFRQKGGGGGGDKELEMGNGESNRESDAKTH
jgi:hypothetical protein